MVTEIRRIRPESSVYDDLRRKTGDVIRFRQLLPNLIRKELKVRYKNSALGFVWSMLNPLLYLVVFFIVFNVFLPSSVPEYHVYLLSGLLAWTFFTVSLTHATVSVVGSPDLVKKVYFPREMLPLAPIGAGIIHFCLQFVVLAGFLIATRHPFQGAAALLVPAGLAVEVILLIGLALFFSAANVKAKDAQHFLDLALLGLFWMTPIVYPSHVAVAQLSDFSFLGLGLDTVYLANPMSRIVMALQRGIYGTDPGAKHLIESELGWYFGGLGIALIISLLVLIGGWAAFNRFDPKFAEEL